MSATSSRFHIRRTVAARVAHRPHLRRRKTAAIAIQPERPRRHVRRFVHLSERLLLGSAMSAGLLLIERRLIRARDEHTPKSA